VEGDRPRRRNARAHRSPHRPHARLLDQATRRSPPGISPRPPADWICSPAVCQAFCGRNAVQRVINVSLLIDHPTAPEVAAACGLRVSDLQRQTAVIKNSTGFCLLDTSETPRLTAESRQLLHDARPVLERYAHLYVDSPGAAFGMHGRSPRTAPAPPPRQTSFEVSMSTRDSPSTCSGTSPAPASPFSSKP